MSGRNSASANSDMRVLIDGWPLARAPGGAVAMHVFELLAHLPPGVAPLLALPTALPHPAPAPVVVAATGTAARGRIAWEQVVLPRLAQRSQANLIHTCAFASPLFTTVPVIVSPAEDLPQGVLHQAPKAGGLGWRLRAALGRGGLSAAGAILWPADLRPAPANLRSAPVDLRPAPVNLRSVFDLPSSRWMPPVAHSAFWREPSTAVQEDEGYVAAFPSRLDEAGLEGLFETWRWAAASMGEGWALHVAGCPPELAGRLEALRLAYGLPGPVLPVTFDDPQAAAGWLAGAGAVLHLGPAAPWGDGLLHTLAAARPIAAEDAWGVAARVGPAAYLAPRADWRALGAAVLTLLVEEQVAEQVSRAAQARAAGWNSQDFSTQLGSIYAGACR